MTTEESAQPVRPDRASTPPAASSPQTTPAPASRGSGGRRWLRRGLWVLLILVVGLLLLVLLLPSLISTGPGTAAALSMVNGRIAGEVSVSDLSVGWSGGQHIAGLIVRDPQGKQVLQVEQIDAADLSLWGLLRGNLHLGTVEVRKPVAEVVQYDDGTTNLQRAFESRTPEEPQAKKTPGRDTPAPSTQPAEQAGIPKDLSVKLRITDGRVTYAAPAMETVTVSNLNLTADAPRPQKIDLVLASLVQQADASGSIDAKITATDLVDAAGRLQLTQAHIDADASLAKLPVVALDRLLGQAGKIAALLGEQLTGQVQAKGTLDNLIATIEAQSPHLALNATVMTRPQAIEVQPNARMSLEVTPPAWQAWTASGQEQSAKLLEPFRVELTVQQLLLPREGQKINFAKAPAQMQLTVGDVLLDTGGQLGRLALRQTALTVQSQGLGQEAKIALGSVAEQAQRTGRLKLDATLRNVLTPDGQLNRANMAADVDGNIQQFPLALVDQLGQTDGLLADLLGPALDSRLVANIKPTPNQEWVTGSFTLTAKAQQLDGKFVGNLDQGKVALQQGSGATLRVEPRALERFLKPDPKTHAKPAQLLEPAVVRLDVQQLTTPLDKTALANLAVSAAVTLERLRLDAGPDVGEVSLRDTRVTVESQQLQKGLHATVTGLAQRGQQQGKVNLTAQVQNLVDAQGAMTTDRMTAVVDGGISDFPLALVDQLGDTGGKAVALLGPTLNLTITQARLEPTKDGQQAQFAMEATAQNFQGKLAGRYTPALLTLEKGSQIALTVDSQALQTLMPAKPGQQSLGLARPAKANITINQLQWPLGEKADPKTGRIDVQGTIDRVELTGAPGGAQPRLEDVRFAIPDTTLGQPVHASLEAKLFDRDQTGTLQAQTTIENVLAASRSVAGEVQVRTLPVSLLDALAQQQGLLLALLGRQLEQISLDFQVPAQGPLVFNSKVESANLKVDAGGQYVTGERQTLTLKDNSTLEITVSPEAYAMWQRRQAQAQPAAAASPAPAPAEDRRAAPRGVISRPAPSPRNGSPAPAADGQLTLAEPATLRVALKQTVISFMPAPAAAPTPAGTAPRAPAAAPATQPATTTALDPANTRIVAAITSPAMLFRRSSDGALVGLRNLNVDLDARDLRKQVTLQIKSDVETTAATSDQPAAPRGQLSSSTKIQNLYNAQGQVDPQHALFDTSTTANGLPVDALDQMFQQQGQLVAALGHTATLSAVGKFTPAESGQLDISLDSQNAKGRIPALFDQGSLRLREDAVMSLRVTPELSQAYLAAMNPILRDATSGQNPVQLTISQKDFSMPMENFDITRMVASMRLDIGTLTLRRSPFASGLVTILRAAGSPIEDREEFPAQFTVLQVDVRDGLIRSNDLWFTTGDLTMGSKVRVRALAGRPTAQWPCEMLLAIPGDTLQLVPKVARHVDPNLVLPIASSGPVGAIKPDFGKLTVAIGQMALQSQAGELGQIGSLVGGVTSALGNKRGDSDTQGWDTQSWPNRPAAKARAALTQPAETTQQQQQQQTERKDPVGSLLEGVLGGQRDQSQQSQQSQQQQQQQQNQQPAQDREQAQPADPLQQLLQGIGQDRRERRERRR